MKVRPCIEDDLAAVHAIQLKCPQAAQWRQEDYQRLAHDTGGTILVADPGAGDRPEVAGFAAFHRVLDEAELRNMAIHPSHRGKGMARALLDEGIRTLREAGALRLFLEVRASNQAALAFYKASGFHVLQRRRDYYHDPAEDALVMAFEISR